jgi:hypothetical protein
VPFKVAELQVGEKALSRVHRGFRQEVIRVASS